MKINISNREKDTIEIPEDGPDLEDPRFDIPEDETEVFYEPPEKLRWEDLLEAQQGNEGTAETTDAPTVHQTQLIYRTLSKLDRAEREAFVLHSVEGWSIPEIATISHMPEGDVQESISQSERFIKHRMGF